MPSLSASASASTSAFAASSTAQNQPQQPHAQSPEDPSFGPLERASKVIDERLARDERWVGVGDSLAGSASSDYVLPPNPAWAPFQKTRTVLLPDRLFEEHDLKQSRSVMGLLPEIERAWVTVDHRLLLWDWSDGSSFSSFDELTDVIVGVGLVKPRAGVFVDSISHILVLTTPTRITLVGLGYAAPSPGAKKEVTFYLTGLSVSTDGISFTTIRGTRNGRIFLASSPDPLTPGGIGGDGCLYELVYQASEGWFVKKCTLHNLTSNSIITNSIVPSFLKGLSAVNTSEWILTLEVDNERGLVYTLLRDGSVEMYQMPSTAPGKGFDGPLGRVAKSGDILRSAQNNCPGSPMLNSRNFKIVALEVISVKEGGNAKVALVAITSTGVRLYFSHQRRGYAYYPISNQPAPLDLVHVRPPPTPASSQPPPTIPPTSLIAFNNIIQAKYASGGLFLAANNLTANVDVILLAAPDVAATARGVAEGVVGGVGNGGTSAGLGGVGGNTGLRFYSEVAGTIEVSGRTWDMAEMTAPSSTGGGLLNELATQVNQPRREWVVLTNMGANVVVRQRPVDTLRDVLEVAGLNGMGSGKNGGGGEIGVFFETYGRDQSCAMLLIIAAGNSRLTVGGDASSHGISATARNTGSVVADHAKSLFFEGGGRPVSVDRGGYGGGSQSTLDSRIIYSGRHEGLAFYFARLLRPIWKRRITRLASTPEDKVRQVTNITEPVLSSVQQDLISLRTFVEREQQLFSALPEGGRSGQAAIAHRAEQTSLVALQLLLSQSVEAISFILLLIDYKISDIISSCTMETQISLLALTYQGLLTTKGGRDVARSLVSSVINQQIGRQLSVDAISDTLQQRCGSFCSADDVLLYKAIEYIRRARDTSDTAERLDCLRESLRLFIRAIKHISVDRLKDVCAEYNEMRYPLGVIDLALNCAHEWDPTDRAVSYWLDGSPPNDARVQAFDLRRTCHELVFAALQLTDDLLDESTQPNRIGLQDQRQPMLSYEEADGLRSNAYQKALSIKDDFFHSCLYDWYLSRGMIDQLLETRTPYLESYLARDPSSLQTSDLLWQYYVRTARYLQAAIVLDRLAEDTSLPIPIHKRVEYLSLAVGNAKSQLPSSKGDAVQFLTECEEKLEVAQVQIEIIRAIEESSLPQLEKENVVSRLGQGLCSISDLYVQFAEPYGLLEIILLILHVSDHRDPQLVEATWEAIINHIHEEPVGRRLESLSSKVVELGRRFHTSDVAFPLQTLVTMMEKYSYENRSNVRSGWLASALHDAGVNWEVIFNSFDELFTGKIPPWHNTAALTFLISDLTSLIEAWLSESTSSLHSSSSPYSAPVAFPATKVDTSVGKYLMVLQTEASGESDTTKERLKEVQRVLRARF